MEASGFRIYKCFHIEYIQGIWILKRSPTSINPETFKRELLRPSFSSQLVLPQTHMITSGKVTGFVGRIMYTTKRCTVITEHDIRL